MVSESDLFKVSGPVHLTSVNWNCPHHQRSIAATLVQGAYVLEHDRQKNRHGPEACAPAWWENFHFELIRKLVDVDDFSIFGAIYEFKSPSSIQNSSNGNAPKFVIAFRGNLFKKESISQDLKLDIRFLINDLDRTPRFEIAMQAVRNLVSAGGQNVWLAGHSLGSAITTLAGKNMAKTGINLRTFLFNPPFISAPLERIKEEKVKQGIRIAKSFITAGLAVAVRGHDNSSEGSFAMLASWVPNLFVNPADVICSEYIGYFEHRKTMEKIGAGHIEKLATQTSGRHMVRSLFLSEPGKESEPLRLLPSARLTRNLSPSPDFRQAHGIRQWWEPDLNLQCEEYIYN
ncbi:GDSL esterase/lipase At4g10955-like isoform X2 [Phoenix dactylifera]|uniref:GDSL esterase/lipase At4g10955-like isoform X2 n=1 Tax=Phoenix dactylifera TaxID=42345 RepID=A0A8B9APS3_PHODC|nr:GDSL esterase/lipase At4g10955-like isoform X2 [Phoenix dactylifera]